ncbi:MAG TPA: acyl-CoA dehydrogenase family protein [Chitinispirillaceae bacterium]|nr:acyl-CoA dehydrogenase family protein [Chitinispirillaceae bacterium]
MFSQEQREFRETIASFARAELNPGTLERDNQRTFSRRLWTKCAKINLFGLPLPEKYGGIDADIPSIIAAMEGLGYGCRDNGLVFSINTQLWSCEIPILHFGSEEQKAKYLPLLCTGESIGGHAMTENNTGSDAFCIQTRAVREGDTYRLNGSKIFITNAPVADIVIVFARTGSGKSFMGLTAFIVERNTPGVIFGKNIELMGLRTCPIGEIAFNDCVIPLSNRLGKEGAGAAIFNSEMEWERSCLFACHIGTMERIVEQCVAYARERRQFGNPIGTYQAVAHRIADMKVRIELSKLMVYKIADLKVQGKPAQMETAIAKLFISEALNETCKEAVQLHGAYGYSSEYELERDFRDAVASTIYSGTSEIQRNTICRLMDL